MRTEDEIRATAREGRAFSNGTEGYAWMDNWCGRCIHDSMGVNGGNTDPYCPLISVAMLTETTPAEWVEQPWRSWTDKNGVEQPPAPSLGDTYHCSEFEERRKGGGGDGKPRPPRPRKQVDGQLDIVDAYLDTAIAALTPAPAEQVTA